MRPPWYSYPFLLTPKRVIENLQRRIDIGQVHNPPNTWQLCLGVARMWHRSIFRTETIGTCPQGSVRDTWRAKILQYRALRLPCLLATGAVAPFDLTGLASSRQRIIRHLVGAHHDGIQFVFDFELLQGFPGALEELRAEVAHILENSGQRSKWLQDLCVYEGYHQTLLAAVEEAIQDGLKLDLSTRQDPDLSLEGYLAWCAAQPPTPLLTVEAIRNGHFDLAGGIQQSPVQ